MTDCVRYCGKSRPRVASNDAAEGHRAKLVVSGEVMSSKIVSLSVGIRMQESIEQSTLPESSFRAQFEARKSKLVRPTC